MGQEPEEESGKDVDSDYNENVKETSRAKEPKIGQLNIPTNILQKTTLTSVHCGVSARAQTMSVADVLVKSGANLKDFKLSKGSANRYRKSEASKVVQGSRPEA